MNLSGHVACAICGVDHAEQLFHPTNSPGPVVRCRRCGLAYVSPRQDAHALITDGPVISDLPLAALKGRDATVIEACWELPSLLQKHADWPALKRNADIALDLIGRYLCPPRRLLDFGCGGGFFLRAASDRGWDTFGLEPLVGHAVYARSITPAVVVADTLRADTFPLDFFDVITAFQVFEHLPDPSGTLQELRQMLKPKGLLLIEVPNFETWSVRLLGKHHRHFVQDHLYFFSASTLCTLIMKYQFEPLLVYRPKRYMTCGHFSTWVARILNPDLGQQMSVFLRRFAIEKKVFSLNLGDIVAVLARKR